MKPFDITEETIPKGWEFGRDVDDDGDDINTPWIQRTDEPNVSFGSFTTGHTHLYCSSNDTQKAAKRNKYIWVRWDAKTYHFIPFPEAEHCATFEEIAALTLTLYRMGE